MTVTENPIGSSPWYSNRCYITPKFRFSHTSKFIILPNVSALFSNERKPLVSQREWQFFSAPHLLLYTAITTNTIALEPRLCWSFNSNTYAGTLHRRPCRPGRPVECAVVTSRKSFFDRLIPACANSRALGPPGGILFGAEPSGA